MAWKKKTSKKRYAAKKRYVKKGKRGGIKKVIRQVLARQVETKHRQTTLLNNPTYFPAQGALYDSTNTVQVGPGATTLDVLQGTADGTRIGNRIRMKKLDINMVFQPQPYDASVNPNPEPVNVKLVLFYERALPTSFPNPRLDFFAFNSTSDAIRGESSDMVAPFNTDTYNILATKTFKLGYSAYTGGSSDPVPQYYNNNDYKMNQIVKWDLTKHYPKVVRYNDNNADPLNRSLYMQVMVSPATGAVGLAGVVPVTYQYWQTMAYTDA